MNGAAGGAAVAAMVQAIKASGVVVRVEPDVFARLLNQNAQGLVVHAPGGMFYRKHTYLMGYKGLAFWTRSAEAMHIPNTCQVVEAKKIWAPG
jgi:hypothetical protein